MEAGRVVRTRHCPQRSPPLRVHIRCAGGLKTGIPSIADPSAASPSTRSWRLVNSPETVVHACRHVWRHPHGPRAFAARRSRGAAPAGWVCVAAGTGRGTGFVGGGAQQWLEVASAAAQRPAAGCAGRAVTAPAHAAHELQRTWTPEWSQESKLQQGCWRCRPEDQWSLCSDGYSRRRGCRRGCWTGDQFAWCVPLVQHPPNVLDLLQRVEG